MVLQYTGDLDPKLRKKLQEEYTELMSGPKNVGKVVPVPHRADASAVKYKAYRRTVL